MTQKKNLNLSSEERRAIKSFLKSGVSKNPLPKEWSDYHICKEMGWSWKQLQETPHDFVAKCVQIGNIVANSK